MQCTDVYQQLYHLLVVRNHDKWSKEFDIRPHRRRVRMVQSYSPGCANVSPCNIYFIRSNQVYNTAQTTKTVSGSAVLHSSRQSVVRHFTACPSPPLKIAPFHGGSEPCMNPTQHPKRHLDRFSRFCTAHGRISQYFTTGRLFSTLKLPLPTGRSGSHLMHGSLGQPESSTQTASRSVQPFCMAR